MTNSSDGHVHLESLFNQLFGGSSRLYRAPGRVNLIGEHTDYNQGFVMPAAIGIYCWVAIAARDDRKLQVYSSEFDATVTVNLDDPLLTRRGDWSDYVVGTALALRNSGYQLRGANILVRGDGRVKITDFGIARIVSQTVTRTGLIFGSPAYMSPDPDDDDILRAVVALDDLVGDARERAADLVLVHHDGLDLVLRDAHEMSQSRSAMRMKRPLRAWRK